MSRNDSASGASSPSSGPEAGARPVIPDHDVLRRIGVGSYGEVWLARNAMGTYRAVKVVYRSHFSEDRPYAREFEGIRNFEGVSRSHPSQLAILHVGPNPPGAYFYYVMELADDRASGQRIDADRYEAKTLRSELNACGALPRAECLKIALSLATALEHLHAKGLVHRDIKPANVIFVEGLPKLADIGLVTAAGKECSFVGTEGYVAPEGPGKPPADVFALGKVLYEMLTGLKAAAHPKLPDEWAVSPDRAAQEMNAIVNQACAANVERRFQTAQAMREGLELLNDGGSFVSYWRLKRSVRVLWAALAALVGAVLLAGGVLGFLHFRNRAADESRRGELREIEISRGRERATGWFTNYWSRLGRAAAIRTDQETLEQASALLAGADARPVAVLRGVSAVSAAFAADGRAVISGLNTQPVMMIYTNGTSAALPVRGEGAVCWTPDGTPLLLADATNGLVLREALTGKVRREFPLGGSNGPGHSSGLDLEITPDGAVAAAARHNRLMVWKTGTGELVGDRQIEGSTIGLSPDGSLVGAGSEDGTVRVYNVPGLALAAVLPPALRPNPILCLAFARDHVVPYGAGVKTNRWLLAAGDKGAGIVIWDVERRLPRSFCRGSTYIVTALAFSPDGLVLASGGRNQPRLWDVASGKRLLTLSEASSGETLAIAFDGTGRRVVCGGEPGAGQCRTALWEIEPQHGILALRGLASCVRRVWFSPDGERVAALSDDWHLGVWEVAPNRLVFLFETPVGVLADNAAGCFDADGRHFAFATGREACLFDLGTGGVLGQWRLKKGLSDQLQFDEQGRLLVLRREAASERGGSIWRLYEAVTPQSLVLLHEQAERDWLTEELALAPGGKRFLVWSGGPRGTPRVIRGYDTASGRELWKAVSARVEGNSKVRLDPSGRWFAYNAEAAGLRFRLMAWSDFAEAGLIPGCEAIGPTAQEFAGHGWVLFDRPGLQGRTALATDWQTCPDTTVFSRDGKFLAWGTDEGVVLVADLNEVRRRLNALGI